MGTNSKGLTVPPETLVRAHSASTKLKQSTETLNEGLREAEEAIRALDLGVHGWVPFPIASDDSSWCRFLNFQKFSNEWKLVMEEGPSGDDLDAQPLLNCNREIRLAAIDVLPRLVEDLVVRAERQAKETIEKVGLLKDFVASTEEIPF